jgi:hypothetical protein
VSKDATLNDRGKKLLEFMEGCNLTILNGSTVGDSMGEFTSYQYNGASIVDYMVVSTDIRDKINHLRIPNITPFSDHTPLLCSLAPKCLFTDSSTLDHMYGEAPEKLKWDSVTSSEAFKNQQNTHNVRQKMEAILQEVCYTKEDVITMNKNMTSILRDIGMKSGKMKTTKKTKGKRMHPKNR